MPYPQAGESREAYVHRFMASPEAQSSFPDQKQRLAVAYSMHRQHSLAHAVRGGGPGHHLSADRSSPHVVSASGTAG